MYVLLDFPPEVAKEWAAFREVMGLLKNIKGVKFALYFHATFCIMYKDEEKSSVDPEPAE